jgi:hypothetical protein
MFKHNKNAITAAIAVIKIAGIHTSPLNALFILLKYTHLIILKLQTKIKKLLQ